MQNIDKKVNNVPFDVEHWFPSDQVVNNEWLYGQDEEHLHKMHSQQTLQVTVPQTSDSLHEKYQPLPVLLPVIQEFKQLIEDDPKILMLFTLMFKQVLNEQDPTGCPQVRNYQEFLRLLNSIIQIPPHFDQTTHVGTPLRALLNWPMGTTAGFAAFLNDKVNQQLKKVLNEWGRYLTTEDSCKYLNRHPQLGWFGHEAKAKAKMLNLPDFEDDFLCNPEEKYFGFKSWDQFFTREWKPNRRPVESPGDDSIIANACESAPLKIASNVKEVDQFWIKAQPYSIKHLLTKDDDLYKQFVGGTVFQAFLSALSYHRWHSPVSGTVVKTRIVEGTYYSEALSQRTDADANLGSQGYIAQMATRGLIFIQADNPNIGLMCVVLIGMTEVSSCDITIKEKQHIEKGDQLGMFHFGGSSYCLLFGPQVELEFRYFDKDQKLGLEAKNHPVKANLAKVLNFDNKKKFQK